MYFKRSVTFRVGNNKNLKGDQKIYIRASWCGQRLELTTPHNIDPNQWDAKRYRCTGKTNSKGVPVQSINTDLDTLEAYMNDAFNRYEFIEKRPPTREELRILYNDLAGRDNKEELIAKMYITVVDAYKRFMSGSESSWTLGTYKKYKTLQTHITEHYGNTQLDTVKPEDLKTFQDFLSKKGLRNITVARAVNQFVTFLRWAKKESLYSYSGKIEYKSKLKGSTVKKVIVLTKEEVQRIKDYRFDDKTKYLEKVRDILIFGCYTGLRYSDIRQLTKAHIKNNAISIVTIKTADPIIIELNDVTKEIIQKYSDYDDVKLLPTISTQKANNYLKEIGRLAKIDEPTETIYYNSDGRQSEIKPKYELLTTHIARRTFITNALSLGIPVTTVMSWSGHSSLSAMKPYIKIVESAKRKEMDKFNELIK